MEAPETFGALLRRLRLARNLTQEALAARATVSARSVSDLERGVYPTARKDTARLLAQGLGMEGAIRDSFISVALGRADSSPAIAVATTAGASRTLPRDVSTFTGRDEEIREIEAVVVGSGRVVSIHAIGGMAGVGKTAFALRVAHRLAARFPDGQIFLSLNGHTPGTSPVMPGVALGNLLATVGFAASSIPDDIEARAGLWRDHLAQKKLLLILDDAVGSEHIRLLLPGAGESIAMITSRRRLTLDDAYALTLDTLHPEDAAALFVRLTGRTNVTVDDPAVRTIAQQCGCLPLALGLVARRLHHHPTWSTTDVAQDLEVASERLRMLESENVSIAAAFDMSYRDLSVDEQRLFRRLGLHPGAEIGHYAAAALDAIDPNLARRRLESLYSHNLLTEPSRGIYRMHDLIREHSRALATDDGLDDCSRTVRRLFDFYLDAARVANRHVGRRASAEIDRDDRRAADELPALTTREDADAWMAAERVNLHAVASHAAAHGMTRHAIGLAAAMHGFLRTHGHWEDGLSLHRTALQLARRAQHVQDEAGALTDLGDMLFITGSYAAAESYFREALGLREQLGDQFGLGETLRLLGFIQYETGDNRLAADSLRRSSECFLQIGNDVEAADTLGSLAVVQHATGEHELAISNQQQALTLHRKFRNRAGEARALQYLGAVQVAIGDFSAAIDNEQQALALSRTLGNVFGQANALNWLGQAQFGLEDIAAASESQDMALKLYRDLGHRMGEANALNSIGALQQYNGEFRSAVQTLDLALSHFTELGIVQGQSEVLNSLGGVALADARHADARDYYERALALAAEADIPAEQARALEGLGRSQLDNNRDDAIISLRAALDLYQRLNLRRATEVELSLSGLTA